MTRQLLLLAILLSNTIAFSQDSLKATAGSIATELNINPFQGSISLNNAINQIKVRKFLPDGSVLRVAFVANFNREATDINSVYGSYPVDTKQVKTKTLLGLNIGFEKHFNGSKRLSPYIGSELVFHNKMAKHTEEDDDYDFTITNGWLTYEYIPGNGYYMSFEERGYTMLGLSALAGFDYYIAKNFYFGYEFTFGISRMKYKALEFKATGNSPTPDNYPDVDNTVINFGSNLLNGIRLGFVF